MNPNRVSFNLLMIGNQPNIEKIYFYRDCIYLIDSFLVLGEKVE